MLYPESIKRTLRESCRCQTRNLTARVNSISASSHFIKTRRFKVPPIDLSPAHPPLPLAASRIQWATRRRKAIMISSEPLQSPPRSLRVHINDLLNPIRSSTTDATSLGGDTRSPSRASASAETTHIRTALEPDTMPRVPFDRRTDARFDTQAKPALGCATSNARSEKNDARRTNEQRYEDTHPARNEYSKLPSHQTPFGLRSAHWRPVHIGADHHFGRVTLPPLHSVHELKAELQQPSPISGSPRDSPYVGSK